MEFTSTPVPWHGLAQLDDAKTHAQRHAEATAERYGYRKSGPATFEITGDGEGGTVVARIDSYPVRHSW